MSDKIPSIYVSDEQSPSRAKLDEEVASSIRPKEKPNALVSSDDKSAAPPKKYSNSGEILPDVAAKWGYMPKDKGPYTPKEPHGFSEEDAEEMRKKGINPDLKWEMEKESRKGNKGFWAKVAQTLQGGGAIK